MVVAMLGCGDEGKLEPEEIELARRLPPARRDAACGEEA